jgi:hypothetical protein
VWLVLWTAGTLAFDVGLSYSGWQQARTQWFHTTPGTVLDSKVEVDHDSEGTSYSVKVKYVYEVNGRDYESERLRYMQSSGSHRWTHATVASLPREKTVTVYYDPQQPSEAVLMPGLAMCDLLGSVFLLPFNLVMLGSWAAVFYAMRSSQPPEGELPANTRVIPGQYGDVVRFPGVSPVMAAGIGSGGAAFILIFVLMFAFDLHGPYWPVLVAWTLILAAGYAAAWWAQHDQISGKYDLLINDSRRMVAMPSSLGEFQSPAWMPFDQFFQTAVFEEVAKDSDGDETKKYFTQLVTKNHMRLAVHEWSSEDDARRFAEWLAQRLRLAPPLKS